MKSFLAGLGLGFGLGMLFAPMRGEDAREMLAVRASELADSARNQYEQARDKAGALADTARNQYELVRGKTEATLNAVRGDQDRSGTQG